MARRAVVLLLLLAAVASAVLAKDPVRLGVAGLVHGHVGWILARESRGDVEIVGISEPDADLATRMADRFRLDPAIVYRNVEEMLDEARPEAVVVFTDIQDHLAVIRACAERGIDVMVEKPLAVSAAQAREIAALAGKHGIEVLTNYETTWYPSVRAVKALVEGGALGEIRKMVARDGHEGPKEIGCGPEFVAWLTDPARNGGGALIDFGCYGVNQMTWLMDGERPESVVAVTQQLKSDPVYARVDDEATILLTYPKAQGIVQGSWNWSFSRKDLDVYGTRGAAFADDRTHLRERRGDDSTTKELPLPEAPYDDCFAYFAAVVRGEVDPSGTPSALSINVTVVEILDAARESARTGRAIFLKP